MKQRWSYKDARGVQVEGFMDGFSDRGGTDVTYFFIRDNGKLDVVSGSRLKDAKNITREYIKRMEQ